MTSMKHMTMAVAAAGCVLAAACGDVVRQGRAPVQLVINSLVAARGNGGAFGGTLLSDVVTLVQQTVNGQVAQVPTTFNDNAQVSLSAILKDPGQPGAPAAPSAINSVTINRYRVVYRRADGRNTPGLDVPFPFDSAVTFTVAAGSTPTTAGFQIVRHTAKEEAPLVALAFNPDVISTLAEVTFYGRDQAGNDVSVTGSIGIDFGNFGDTQ